MILQPYQTTPLGAYNLSRIEKEINVALIEGELRDATTKSNAVYDKVKEIPPSNKVIPQFGHPIAITRGTGETYWVIDTRPYTSIDRLGVFQVRDHSQHDFMVMRGVLSRIWAEGEQGLFITLGDIAPKAFATWISDNLTRALNLNPQEQQNVAIAAAWYYMGLFEDASEMEDEITRRRLSTVIANLTRSNPNTVLELMGEHRTPHNITEFVELLKSGTFSPRLAQMSVGFLYSVLRSSWFSTNDQEMVNVSLEHPPTWITMVYSAFNDRLYHRTFLTKLLQKLDKGQVSKTFTYNLLNMIGARND